MSGWVSFVKSICPIDEFVVRLAGRIPVVVWMVGRNPALRVEPSICYAAAAHGQLATLQRAVQLGCSLVVRDTGTSDELE